MISHNSANVEGEYVAYQFNYTTVEIEQFRFSGETPNLLYYAVAPPEKEIRPASYAVIDGELCELKDESPPNAQKIGNSSGLFKLAELP
jgi:hypothetical protein